MVFWKDLNDTGLKAAEEMINNTLQYDPATLNRLANIKGKTIVIECILPHYLLAITVQQQGICLQKMDNDRDGETQADAHIKGSLPQLLQLLLATDKNTTLINSAVEISGDIRFASQLQTLLRDLDIDWEAMFAKIIGDVGANTAGDLIRKASQFQRHTTQRCFENMGEFLQEELQVLPSNHELQLFYREVDDLRLHTDRLQACIQALATRLDKDNSK